ncbi:hypothetical protein D3C75_944030 [compost metagenome]
MRNRSSQLNVAHTLPADLGSCHFDAAAVADNALVADTLVLAAMAFPVLLGTEDTLAEQAFLLRLQGTVVDGFRFFDFATGPGTNFLR